jgi:hypothetical protein
MTQEQVQQIIDLITTVGGQLTTTGFAIAVRQVVVESAVWLTADLAFLIFVLVTMNKVLGFNNLDSKRRTDKGDDSSSIEGDRVFWIMIIRTVGYLTSAAFLFNLITNLVKLLNPQWYAATMLIGLVK